MIEHDKPIESAVLVHVNLHEKETREDLFELEQLAQSAGLVQLNTVTTERQSPDPKYFVGLGKANELASQVKQYRPTVILFNHALSPGQTRNLERLCRCRVIDRIDLILAIFADRARTFEGKLQVELAQLRHLSTRLVRGWTHLERQKGGIGLRGPGETQLETDRRLLRQRIKTILHRLEKVKAHRTLGRRARQRTATPTIALVGYTNAGKSTLFNTLTGAEVYAADQLFATLDPTLRRLNIPDIGDVVIADTVGFIKHLPPDLVKAFQATLEEVCQADLLLHVIDASSEHRDDNIKQVESVLEDIDASHVPQLAVYNKIDALPELKAGIEWAAQNEPERIFISAEQSMGLPDLLQAIRLKLRGDMTVRTLCLPVDAGKIRAKLHHLKAVLSETINEQGHFTLTVRLPTRHFEYYCRDDD